MPPYVLLGFAIVAEVIGTTALKASDGMHKIGPVTMVVVGYGLSFWLMGQVLKSLPVGLVYAIWSGVGLSAVSIVGQIMFGEVITMTGALGIGLIIIGIIVLQISAPGVP